MSCNRGVSQSKTEADALGCPALEAAWGEARSGVPALVAQPRLLRRWLGCGHWTVTSLSGGKEEWCDKCDGWSPVSRPMFIDDNNFDPDFSLDLAGYAARGAAEELIEAWHSDTGGEMSLDDILDKAGRDVPAHLKNWAGQIRDHFPQDSKVPPCFHFDQPLVCKLTDFEGGAVLYRHCFEDSAEGRAAYRAAKELSDNWDAALGDGYKLDKLLPDVNEVTGQLRFWVARLRGEKR